MKQLVIISSLCWLVASETLRVSMPGALPKKNDDYICTRIPLPDFANAAGYVTSFKADVGDAVHHIILSGCSQWMEGHEATTPGSCDLQCNEQTIFAWAHQGAPLSLPPGVAFEIGRGSAIQSMNMEVHYMKPLTVPDNATIEMTFIRVQTPFRAGVYLMFNNDADIPAHAEHYSTNISCR